MRLRQASRIGSLLIIGGTMLCGTASAMADTYQLPIRNGNSILKVYVDGGTARRVGMSDGVTIFEIDMTEAECSREVRLAFTDAPTIYVPYDVCSETGFGLTSSWD